MLLEILRMEKRAVGVQGGHFLFHNVNVPGKIYEITTLTPLS